MCCSTNFIQNKRQHIPLPNKVNMNPSKTNPGKDTYFETKRPDTAILDKDIDLSKGPNSERLGDLKMQATGSRDDSMRARNQPTNPLESNSGPLNTNNQ